MTIRILSPRLANQIAAGEVVERPASVVKELLENAIDAGANRISVDIEQGGQRLMRIRDNGCGIPHDQLALALARHATSKISDLDDLEAIVSFGFRGEALASISSVSRLTLTSRPAGQSEAWQASCEGREMAVVVQPAAHPDGSTLEVRDLFFNTPARRRFLRSEKTEFEHIDDVCRRIGLAHQQLQLQWSHNGKLIRQLPAATDEASLQRRVAAVVGERLLQRALRLEWQHQGLSLHGWLWHPHDCQPGAAQYAYVNGRSVRDKLLNHAVRQAYGPLLAAGQTPGYLLFLELDPREVDVNVHPAKHEVRFHNSRLVHDFMVAALNEALRLLTPEMPTTDNALSIEQTPDAPPAPLQIMESAAATPPAPAQLSEQRSYPRPLPAAPQAARFMRPAPITRPHPAAQAGYLQLLQAAQPLMANADLSATATATSTTATPLLIKEQQLIVLGDDNLWALPLPRLWAKATQAGMGGQGLPLLMPMRVQLTPAPSAALLSAWTQAGIHLHDDGRGQWLLRAVPPLLRQLDWANLLQAMVAAADKWPELAAAAVSAPSWQQLTLADVTSWLGYVADWQALAHCLPLAHWLSEQKLTAQQEQPHD